MIDQIIRDIVSKEMVKKETKAEIVQRVREFIKSKDFTKEIDSIINDRDFVYDVIDWGKLETDPDIKAAVTKRVKELFLDRIKNMEMTDFEFNLYVGK